MDVDDAGNVFVADQGNHSIRYISAVDSSVVTIAGCRKRGKQDGDGLQVSPESGHDVVVSSHQLSTCMLTVPHSIRYDCVPLPCPRPRS